MLHLHGFADYFFQTAYAEWWTERGYDFYALDLRKYGRSLRPHQTPNYVTDLRDYFAEIDAAWHRVTERDGHTEVVISAHSTGGLIVGLWADERQPAQLAGMVLNSPWLDLQGSALLRVVGTPVLKQVGARQPMREIKRTVAGFYSRSLHRDHDGEWDFNLPGSRSTPSRSTPAGCARSARPRRAAPRSRGPLPRPRALLRPLRPAQGDGRGRARLRHRARRAPRSGTGPRPSAPTSPTSPIEGARHDVVLSRAEPRAAAYDAIATWMTAWVDPPSRSLL